MTTRHAGTQILLLAIVLTGFAVTAVGSSSPAAETNWPQWRGPGGEAISAETGFATEWSPTSNIKWSTEIEGRGHSSPVVWGDRIFLTTSLKGDLVPGRKAPVHLDFNYQPGYEHPDAVDIEYRHTMKVLGIDAKTGKVLWNQVAFEGLMEYDHHRKNTYASSTVATDGELVYAFFESLGIYAYDFDGKLKWKASVGNVIKAGLGPGTSPILYKNLVILQCDQEMGTGSSIIALDKKTGAQVWKAERTTRRSWATPIIVHVGDHDELVASGAEMVMGYDPATGKELWRADGTQSHPIPSPVAGHGFAFMSAGSQQKRAFAIKLGGSGDLTGSPSVAWRYNKGAAYVPSPILYGDYFYLMSDAGIVTCLEATTGKVVYEGGRPPVPATFTASFVAFDGKLMMTSEDGDSFVIKAGPEFAVLGTNSIGEPVYASPALSNGVIYIRGERHLFAIAEKSK